MVEPVYMSRSKAKSWRDPTTDIAAWTPGREYRVYLSVCLTALLSEWQRVLTIFAN